MRPEYVIDYRINNNKRTSEQNHRTVDVYASQEDIESFTRTGYLVRSGWWDEASLTAFRTALDEQERTERDLAGAEYREGNGFFLRGLQDKREEFRDLSVFAPPLSIARAMLGPQISVEIDARIAYEGDPDKYVPWHIHRRVIPDPLPPFFCHPHGVHCLIYLNDVGPDEGPLVVLPGSHLDNLVTFPYEGSPDVDGQVMLEPKAGDAVLIHSNLWHRTVPTNAVAERRRLLIVGYDPCWLATDVGGDTGEVRPLTDPLRAASSPAVHELAGGFRW